MEETGNGKMIVITGNKVKDVSSLVDRIAKLTAAHYLSAVEYELSKRTEQQIKRTLLKLYHEKKYWEAVGILMEIFNELEDDGAQDLLVVLNAERTESRREHPEKVREWKRTAYLREKEKIAAMDPETYRKYREEKNAKYREYRRRKKAEAEAKIKEQEKLSKETEAVQNQVENMIESE